MTLRATLQRTGALLLVAGLAYILATRTNINPAHHPGEIIDTFNGVPVYYNGGVGSSTERHLAPDGYNLGLKFQCVEFVKRYYYTRFSHRMPETRGNAKDFFDANIPSGAINPQRGLIQYANGNATQPAQDDLLVMGPTILNPYGHVAIVTRIAGNKLEIVQQNAGPFSPSREWLPLSFARGKWHINNCRVKGWLRLPAANPVNTIQAREGSTPPPNTSGASQIAAQSGSDI